MTVRAGRANVRPLKASLIDDGHFALRAIPFTGPIPSRTWPGGVDIEGETFTPETDIKPHWFKARAVDFHHGKDWQGAQIAAQMGMPVYQPLMGRTVIGRADNLHMQDDGWWVDVWIEAGARRLDLVRRLAERGAQLFGSSEPIGSLVKVKASGEIAVWPYLRQTLSTSPVNTHSILRPLTHSILRPLKADLDSIGLGGHYPSEAFWQEMLDSLHDLGPDLLTGAKAGRTDGRALADMLSAADAQVERLRALYLRA